MNQRMTSAFRSKVPVGESYEIKYLFQGLEQKSVHRTDADGRRHDAERRNGR
jgi:hypothetical protein